MTRQGKWAVFAVALGMMAATAGWLTEIRGRHLLGPAGVRVSSVPIYDEKGQAVSAQSIVLPANVLGISGQLLPITATELGELPKDTTFGRRHYPVSWTAWSDLGIQVNVVLMGADHTSIHQPQYCLYAQNWTITHTDRINLPMAQPFADIPAIRITATQQDVKTGQMIECLYIYWFVSGNKITADEGSRLWSMWKTVLQKGEMERWAYISYFATCHPGAEQSTFEHLEKFIRASVPEFQLVKGNPSGETAMAAQK